MNENIYEVGGKTFAVDELNVDQKRELAKLMKVIGVGGLLEGGIDLEKILDAIGEHDQLARFYAIICTEKGKEWDAADLDENQKIMGKMKGSQEAGVIEDFLSVNASWFQRLKNSLAPMMETDEVQPPASNQQRKTTASSNSKN
ncbi:MAG: hypothetical protein ACE5I1_11435 [bacterium]